MSRHWLKCRTIFLKKNFILQLPCYSVFKVGFLIYVKYFEMFLQFTRDPPEPTGEETEDADLEAPKVYEKVRPDFQCLELLRVAASE